MNTPSEQQALRAAIHAREVSFAVGVPGVAAEFHWVGDEAVTHDDGGLGIATARGALRIEPHGATRVRAGHGTPEVWWMTAAQARVYTRSGLAELGPDDAAVRAEDRAAVLFDLGLALGHVRACVRTSDPALLAGLRAHLGQDVLHAGHPVIAAIKAAGPHRVFATRMARIEVYQPIPSRARAQRTPPGPHTHLLPALIGRPDPACADLPADACAVLSVYPASIAAH